MPLPSSTVHVSVLIPALNEEEAIGLVLDEIPRELGADLCVVDNGSTDGTAAVAAAHGARVIRAAQRGYGAACRAGLAGCPEAELVVFLDGDHSDYPEEMPRLLAPLLAGEADLVIGSRVRGRPARGALTPQQIWGNRLACLLVRLLTGQRYSDLGPFRAVRRTALERLRMQDADYGWTAEMQVKAARAGLRVVEIPVRYRPRLGRSKISGTWRGSLAAGSKIIRVILRYARWKPPGAC
jgi:glycosyltransferase involved in cell wall biosynthesis